jgi:ribosomal protein L37E
MKMFEPIPDDGREQRGMALSPIERRCGVDSYCNSLRLCGHHGPRCGYCDSVEVVLERWAATERDREQVHRVLAKPKGQRQ